MLIIVWCGDKLEPCMKPPCACRWHRRHADRQDVEPAYDWWSR